ncbi:MAG TPA: GGDEF domain-containing protein [Fibrobacteria bacterium]|nr:GGDEF domain-containing protein [Fibrobacteria bacterium]HOX50847.1 GGDEF domain-containing protein [Fibrobacteria bacterium]
MSHVDLPGTPGDIFAELLMQEVHRGERVSWIFRWVVHGFTFLLTVVCMNTLFALAHPRFDASIANQLICGGLLGELYRTAYILLFGLLLLFIPSTINRLLKAQKTMIEHNMENYQKAHHDTLTGLPNRRLLMDFLTKSIALSGRKRRRVAVIYLDLDGFKPINDRLGHDGGDEVLVCVAKRILSVVRESDLASRVGGDEFVVVAQEIDGRSGAETMARRILEAIQAPMTVKGIDHSLGVSIGVAIYPLHGSTAEELVHVADKAMYLVKNGSKSDFTILD